MTSPSGDDAAVIDSHLHVWDTADFTIGWIAGAGLPARSPIPEGEAGRLRYVLVEADADDAAAETAWLARLAEQDPRVHGLVVSLPLEQAGTDPNTVEEALDRIDALPAVLGVRRLLQDRNLFGHPGMLAGLTQLTARGLPFDACVRAYELPALTALLEQVPELTVVLDHMGKPPVQVSDEAMQSWRSDLARLAELPQVHCKLSGLPAECRDQAQLDDVAAEIVTYAYRLFGPVRSMVGSDRPVSSDRPMSTTGGSRNSYHDDDWCARVLALIPSEHRDAVGYQNAARIYRRRS